MSKTPVKQLTDYFSTPLSAVRQPGSSENQFGLQGAFYNAAAFVFVSLGLGAAVAAYYVLEAFIKPLLWAALCGAFLYPFKKTLSSTVRTWLRSLSSSSTPLAVGVVLLPFTILNEISAIVGVLIFSHVWELLILLATSLALYLFYLYQPFYEIILTLNSVGIFLYHTMDYFSNPLWVWSFVISYVIMVVFFWTPSYSRVITVMAYPVWMVLLLHLASIAGKFRVPLFLFVFGLCVVGAFAEIVKAYKGQKMKQSRYKIVRSLSLAASVALNDDVPDFEEEVMDSDTKSEAENDIKDNSSSDVSHIESIASDGKQRERPKLVKHKPVSDEDRDSNSKPLKPSNIFFLGLFWAIGLVCIVKNVWILELVTVLIAIYVIKNLLLYIGTDNFVYQQYETSVLRLKQWAKDRKDVLAPAPLRGLARILMSGDKKMVLWIEQFMDKLISICMIMCLILGTLLLGAIMAVEVQRESMHLVQVTGDLVNDAIAHYPELFKHWLPENKDFHDILQSTVDQVYLYGRHWLANKVQNLAAPKEKNNSQLKKDILELTDRLYHSWRKESNSSVLQQSLNTSDISNATMQKPSESHGFSLHKIFNRIKSHEALDLTAVFSILKENIGTLLSVLESVWLIFKSNMNLAFSIVTALLSLVFSSGTYLLNAGFSTIVFLTALFYLLSFSEDQYLPVFWVSTLSGSEASLFGEAIYTAIRGVFGASLKMAAFYGLYTWLTHTLFGVKIIFIPSAIAAVTGVVPFVASYWAAVPAVLELWLIDSKEIQAVLLAICHVLPTYVVDTVIYSEIKGGGHPYLTGLAVAGGIYCIGLEGAIVGPIVLCCLVAAFNVHRIIMHGSDSTVPSVTE